MPSIPDGLLDAATKDLGYREKDNGYTKFGDWYYANVDKSDPYFKTAPWCDMFITWAATQAGVEEYVGEFAYTVDHAKWFKQKGAWSDKPEPGAIVFYDWGGSRSIEAIDHAGIVEKVDGERIATIEANVDEVWLKRKERDQSKVVGYGLPRKVQEKDGPQVLQEEDRQAVPLGNPDSDQPVAAKASMSTSVPAPQAIQEAAMPAVLIAVLVGAAVLARRVSVRRSPPAANGRHRRSAGRHSAAFA